MLAEALALLAVGLVEARGLAQGSEALGSANSPRAKAPRSVPDAAQDEELAQARAGGRGNSTGTSAEGGTPADDAQPAAEARAAAWDRSEATPSP